MTQEEAKAALLRIIEKTRKAVIEAPDEDPVAPRVFFKVELLYDLRGCDDQIPNDYCVTMGLRLGTTFSEYAERRIKEG